MALNGIVGDEQWGYSLFEDRRPSLIVLEKLRARLTDLNFGTGADHPAEIAKSLSRAFSVLPMASSNPTLQVEVYLEELADLPAAPIISVIRRYIRGELGDGCKFMPTIAEIRREVGRLCVPIDRERSRIMKVLEFWGGDIGQRSDVKLISAGTNEKAYPKSSERDGR